MGIEAIKERIKNVEVFDEDKTTIEITKLDEDDLVGLSNTPEIYQHSLYRIRPPMDIENGQEPNVKDYLCSIFAERDEVIRILLACTIAQVPMVLLGPPGTAKSAIVRTFCEALGLREKHHDITKFEEKLREALQKTDNENNNNIPEELAVSNRRLFEYLVTRYTTPEEILGPVNIDAMLKLSMYYRESAGMLPNAQIAFLDEIFKANSAILNALLSIINERIYYNAGRAFNVNLLMVIGASNESPDVEELAALYDRFPIRVLCDPVPDESIQDLLDKSLEQSYKKGVASSKVSKQADRGGKDADDSGGTIACINDFLLMSRINYVQYGGAEIFNSEKIKDDGSYNFAEEFMNLFLTLREEFGISDRTPERLIRVVKALALVDNKDELEPDLLRVFKYCAPDIDTARVLSDIVEETIERIS